VVDSGLGSTAYGVGIAKQLLDDGAGTAAVAAYNRFYASRFVRRSGDFPSVTDTAGLQSALQGGTAQRDLQALDAVRRLEASHVVDVHQLHFYESWTALPDLLAFLRRTVPAGMPIQAWEVGRYALDDGVDAQHRAGDVVKLATQLLAGGVSPVIWLPTAVNPTGRHADEPRYGLLDPSGAVRPAGAAFAALAQAARSATIRRVDGDGLEGVAFAGHGRSTLVVWSDTGGRLLPRPRATATAASAAGGTLTWPSWGLVVADQPVLMAVAAPLPKAMRILSSKETP
jgi:hypothetical protein